MKNRRNLERAIVADVITALDKGALTIGVHDRVVNRLLASISSYESLGLGDIDDVHAPAPAAGPATSKIAASMIAPHMGTVRWQLVEQFAASRSTGWTCDELEQKLGKPHTTVSSAINWLRDHGWLEDSGGRDKTRSGRPAIIWRITPQGMNAWRTIDRERRMR